jgi:gluconolactonase
MVDANSNGERLQVNNFRAFRVLLGVAGIAVCLVLIASSPGSKDHVEVQSTQSVGVATQPQVERLDRALDRLIPPSSKLLQIVSGLTWTEGPLWLPAGKLIFAEIPSNSIRVWSPDRGAIIFMQPTGYKGAEPYGGPEPGSNGMALDTSGRLSVAGHAQRDVWRLEQMDSKATETLLADSYRGKRLNSPNDLVYKSDGSLYFTDPPYGLRTQSDKDSAKELGVNGVYRIPGALEQKPGSAPDRSKLQLLIQDLPRPNGIVFSPDERYLYVDNSEPEMYWMRYTVKVDGSLTDGKRFGDAGVYAHQGAPDGMKVDREGNIYSAGPGGVWIFSPQLKHLGTIQLGVVGNVAWGDDDYKTLYIAAGPNIYSIRLAVPGSRPLHH